MVKNPLPNVLGPILPKGDTLEGLFYEIKTNYSENPIEDRIVLLNSSIFDGNINNVILWKGDWASGINSSSLEMYFPLHYVFLTNYTMRSPLNHNATWYYQKEWRVYGYNEDTRADPNKWTILHEGESSDTVFCGTEKFCNYQMTNTFQTNPIFSTIGFKYIRFETTVPSGRNIHFITSGIDLYGVLNIDKKYPYPQRMCTFFYRFQLSHFYTMSSIFLLKK